MRKALSGLAVVVSGSLAMADVTFVFDYSGSVEFNDPTLGAARRAALEDAAGKLGRVFDHTQTVNIEVTSVNDVNQGFLASAYTEYASPALTFFGYWEGVVMDRILTGVDANGGLADGGVEVNFGYTWDLDDDVSPGAYDFKSTIIHELLHAVGFLSGVMFSGEDYWGDALGDPSVWDVFDDYLCNSAGTPLIDDVTFELDVPLWNSVRTGGASPGSGLFFNGPMAMAANGGQPVGLYSPGSWEEGSSGSHLDDDNPSLEGSLMLSGLAPGKYRRSLTDIERGILMDIGYSLNPLLDPAIEVTAVNPGTSVTLQLSGPEDRWYVIEVSEDLDDWDDLDTVELLGGSVSVPVPITVSDTKLFFRMRETSGPPAPAFLRMGPVQRVKR
ncbi:hypothetical protein [Haloferula rosea]|uniref:Uncharacterized protein n=1 Tax=Haloferula rosea TaxID=490093 RepID=A0A934RDN2_9BACT|nr:hypothetical protein [Haloferula rosea]MBK1827758.1 hypothetical protein [Haloferula rosea]